MLPSALRVLALVLLVTPAQADHHCEAGEICTAVATLGVGTQATRNEQGAVGSRASGDAATQARRNGPGAEAGALSIGSQLGDMATGAPPPGTGLGVQRGLPNYETIPKVEEKKTFVVTKPAPPAEPPADGEPGGVVVADSGAPWPASTSPEAFKPVFERVTRLTASGRGDEARQAAREALAQNPGDPALQELVKRAEKHEAKLTTAGLVKKIGSLLWNSEPGASPQFQQQTAASPAQPQAQLATPIGALTAAVPPQAVAPAAQLPQSLSNTVSRTTFLKMQMADYAGAETDLTQAIARKPDDWMAYRLRGLTRRFLKKYPEAEADVDQALKLNPRDGPSMAVKALVRLDQQDAEGAVEHASLAVALNPKDADALVTRGKAYMALGRSEEALDDLKLAADIAPQFGALYRRALADTAPASSRKGLSRAKVLYLAVGGLGLFLFGSALIVRRTGATTKTVRPMRAEDDAPRVGGFHILRRIGQGGMGVVFEAFDETLERRVAIKRMRSEISGDPRERRRFLKEARVVAGLRHPSIVEIFSVVERDDELFLVFEFLPGDPLSALIEKRGRLPAAEVLKLGGQIAGALDFAHAHGVVHQDLKPGNVLITPSGTAKVMDFGIARRVQETLSTMSRSEALGTPIYMAPEQEQGIVTPKADLFAFGVCLYELLSGRPPFSGATSGFAKVEKRYPPLSQAAGLPEAVDAAIARALDPNPTKRPETAIALVRSLADSLL